jgi:SAM-dependent methyltransferase
MASHNNSNSYKANEYNKTASFVYSTKFTSAVLDLLDAKPGERIIDFGCGSGELDLELAKIVGAKGIVVGADASQSMVRNYTSDILQNVTLRILTEWNRSTRLRRTVSNMLLSAMLKTYVFLRAGLHRVPISQTRFCIGVSATQRASF